MLGKLLFFNILLLLLHWSTSKTYKFGQCLTGGEYFGDTRFDGKWYEYARSPNKYEDADTKCAYFYFDAKVDKKVEHKVDLRFARFWLEPSNNLKYMAFYYFPFYNGTAKNLADFDIKVLSTDYENYAIMYGCLDIWFVHAEIIWLLTRKPIIDDRTELQPMWNYLDEHNITYDDIVKVDQSECPNDLSDTQFIFLGAQHFIGDLGEKFTNPW